MANKSLFKSLVGKLAPSADTRNSAGGRAYAMPPKQALAQLATTGCLNSTFYVSGEDQLASVLELSTKVEPEFLARLALYARQRGNMKDMPALLTAILSVRGPGLMAEIFDRVIDSPKMLRNFVQIMRSGVVGRKSLGSLPKRLVTQWLDNQSDQALFRASVGNDPSLADVIKMVHPKPATEARKALFAYLIGRAYDAAKLPELVLQYEAFKASKGDFTPVPDVPMNMLTSLPLTTRQWEAIAQQASWQTTRMNLNTFERHGVLQNQAMVGLIADRLRDAKSISRARAFPYQLLVAYTMAGNGMPGAITEALQDAMEVAVGNVPEIDGKVWVLPDVSGSMHSAVTGYRTGATSAVRCIDVAALVAAAMVRKNRGATVLPFSDAVVETKVNPRDSVMTIAKQLASLPSGGTNCSAPLQEINRQKAKADLVIFVSDNESWVDTKAGSRRGEPTQVMRQWEAIKSRNPGAKLVCIDLTPNTTVQATDRKDILNIGGFSDTVFDLVGTFAKDGMNADNWVGAIEAVQL